MEERHNLFSLYIFHFPLVCVYYDVVGNDFFFAPLKNQKQLVGQKKLRLECFFVCTKFLLILSGLTAGVFLYHVVCSTCMIPQRRSSDELDLRYNTFSDT